MVLTAIGYASVAVGAASDRWKRDGLWVYMGITLLMSLCQFPLATLLTSKSTSRVPGSLKGTLIGTEHAAFAGVGFLGPAFGVRLLQEWGISGFALACGAIYLLLFGAWTLVGISAFADDGGATCVGLSPRAGVPDEAAPLISRGIARDGPGGRPHTRTQSRAR
tara:strand:- start:1166 stop:1657 length:492 start_codon:yes stop_codon:yes gene_type:complete